jgi:hypothetical protein
VVNLRIAGMIMDKHREDGNRGWTKAENKEYALALEAGKKRFGSPCKHIEVKNGVCCNCLRKVV